MNILKILILSFALSGGAVAGEVILHTATTHFGMKGVEDFTPGIAYSVSGYRFGYLNNSYNIDSLYAAKEFRISKTLRLGIGFITGYQWDDNQIIGKENGIMPLMAVEKDISKNMSLLWAGRAVNLEFRF